MENPNARLANEMAIKLIIKRQGETLEAPPLDEKSFAGPIITIGSDPAASLCLSAAGIAPEQAIIINEDGAMLLISRADGTALNDEALAREARRPLAPGDRLQFAGYVIIFDPPSAHTDAAQTALPSDEASSGNEILDPDTQASTQPGARPTTSPASTPSNGQGITPRNFAAILDSLRTEEDSFYFLIEGGTQSGRRIPIESAEAPLGWDDTGQNISFNADTVVATRALLRKDWSGVVVQPQGAGMVAVNGEPVQTTRRLRNGDRLMIVPTMVTAAQSQSFLIFHEPASLLVLDSLLPQKLPPPVSLAPSAQADASLVATEQAALPVANQKRAKIFDPQRKVLGYFTMLEVLIMIIGTLVLAVIIFLVLEYS